MQSDIPESAYRQIHFGVTRAIRASADSGVSYLRAENSLEPYGLRMTDRFAHWAQTTPERTWLAQRVSHSDGSRGDWRRISYARGWVQARNIAQALLQRNLSADRPVLILSHNSIEHALLSMGCMIAGVPWCPVSAAYSTVSTDYAKLRHVVDSLTPGLVFATEADTFGRAIQATLAVDVEVVLMSGYLEQRTVTPYTKLELTKATSDVDQAIAETGPDSIVKFMFTSGSTKLPKPVINTHRMWCSNQQQMRQSMSVSDSEPPVLVDWLPWNHTFGGNHNFGLVLYNGGTLYIDEGKPVPALMGETLRNLREVSPTHYFNVPSGFEAIGRALQQDNALRKKLFSRVQTFFYAGAAMAQPVWDSLYKSAELEIGQRIAITSGLGMTESGPACFFATRPDGRAGELGLPMPGLDVKLVPVQGKLEARYRGPNITPGYWRSPEETANHIDQEGFFCSGDAVAWIDECNVNQGLRFDGRIAEDFKLDTGTFVSVANLRTKIMALGAPYVNDVVITGANRHLVGAMIFPNINACRQLSAQNSNATVHDVLRTTVVTRRFQKLVDSLAQDATGSANRIAFLCLLEEPPSHELGEVTDKGSINQRVVLALRETIVNSLYEGTLANMLQPTSPSQKRPL